MAAFQITPEQIHDAFPSATLETIQEHWPGIQAEIAARGVTSRAGLTAAAATIATETGTFAPVAERGSKKYFAQYDKIPGHKPGDGYRYRGRGFTQLTGKWNYEYYGKLLDLDLVGNPDLALDPENAARIAAEFWKRNGLFDAAESGDWERTRRTVNPRAPDTDIAKFKANVKRMRLSIDGKLPKPTRGRSPRRDEPPKRQPPPGGGGGEGQHTEAWDSVRRFSGTITKRFSEEGSGPMIPESHYPGWTATWSSEETITCRLDLTRSSYETWSGRAVIEHDEYRQESIDVPAPYADFQSWWRTKGGGAVEASLSHLPAGWSIDIDRYFVHVHKHTWNGWNEYDPVYDDEEDEYDVVRLFDELDDHFATAPVGDLEGRMKLGETVYEWKLVAELGPEPPTPPPEPKPKPKPKKGRSRSQLAKDILGSDRIELANDHVSGVRDDAGALKQMHDTAAGKKARRSEYGTAPGGEVYLSKTMLEGLLKLSEKYSLKVSELAGASHRAGSAHYQGGTADITIVDGEYVSIGHARLEAFRKDLIEAGAIPESILYPANEPAFHGDHFHATWPMDPSLLPKPKGPTKAKAKAKARALSVQAALGEAAEERPPDLADEPLPEDAETVQRSPAGAPVDPAPAQSGPAAITLPDGRRLGPVAVEIPPLPSRVRFIDSDMAVAHLYAGCGALTLTQAEVLHADLERPPQPEDTPFGLPLCQRCLSYFGQPRALMLTTRDGPHEWRIWEDRIELNWIGPMGIGSQPRCFSLDELVSVEKQGPGLFTGIDLHIELADVNERIAFDTEEDRDAAHDLLRELHLRLVTT